MHKIIQKTNNSSIARLLIANKSHKFISNQPSVVKVKLKIHSESIYGILVIISFMNISGGVSSIRLSI